MKLTIGEMLLITVSLPIINKEPSFRVSEAVVINTPEPGDHYVVLFTGGIGKIYHGNYGWVCSEFVSLASQMNLIGNDEYVKETIDDVFNKYGIVVCKGLLTWLDELKNYAYDFADTKTAFLYIKYKDNVGWGPNSLNWL